jgi:hypothetical protein
MRGGLGAWEWMKKIHRPKVVPAMRASKTTHESAAPIDPYIVPSFRGTGHEGMGRYRR